MAALLLNFTLDDTITEEEMTRESGCPRLVVAATGSGVGKTSTTLGILRALARRGLRVQPFKVGPDFLDPTYLSLAAGTPCYNLDSWMMGGAHVERLFARCTADVDMAVIEGVMGLFDGADATGLSGSTAEIAKLLSAPVLLLVHGHGVGRSIAPLVYGFDRFEPGLRIAGVVANRTGSVHHREILAEALAAAGLPPLIGAVPRDAYPELKSRHLGLLTADHDSLPEEVIESLADAVEANIDLTQLLAVMKEHTCSPPPVAVTRPAKDIFPVVSASEQGRRHTLRIGVARDEAFHFYYPDNLQLLETLGAELIYFSPLLEHALPAGLDALYLGGGYPEVHAKRLSGNTPMLHSLRAFAESGRGIYAECGGLVYLSQSVEILSGERYPLAGLLPFRTRMLPRRRALGYVEVELTKAGLFGEAGTLLRGHEFHYSEIAEEGDLPPEWSRLYRVTRRRGRTSEQEGFVKKNILASYMHLHWGGNLAAASSFLDYCAQAAARS